MARAVLVESPEPGRRVLSSSSVVRNSSLEPILVSRGKASRDPEENSIHSLRTYDNHYNRYYRYYHERSDPSTPKNMFDGGYYLPRGHDKSTRFNDDVRYYYRRRPYSVPRRDVSKLELTPVYVTTTSRFRDPRFVRDPQYVSEPRWGRFMDDPHWGSTCCLIFLKFLQLIACLVILVISRTGAGDLDLDITYTVFALVGFLVAASSLLIFWCKGYPTPGDCMHLTMLFAYAITALLMLAGAILAFVQSTKTDYAYAVGSMFLVAMLFFIIDIIFMIFATELCDCAPSPLFSYPGARRPRVLPWADHRDDGDYYVERYPRRVRPNDVRSERVIVKYPLPVRDGYYLPAARTAPAITYPGY